MTSEQASFKSLMYKSSKKTVFTSGNRLINMCDFFKVSSEGLNEERLISDFFVLNLFV
jgi:hypothetical protein